MNSSEINLNTLHLVSVYRLIGYKGSQMLRVGEATSYFLYPKLLLSEQVQSIALLLSSAFTRQYYIRSNLKWLQSLVPS